MKFFKRSTALQTDSAMTLTQASVDCLVRIEVVARETNPYKWAISQLIGMSLFAYVVALAVFQIGFLLGFQ